MLVILKEVEELGRMHNRFKTANNAKECAENQLARLNALGTEAPAMLRVLCLSFRIAEADARQSEHYR